MRQPYKSKLSDSWCSWWKHKRPIGKRNTARLVRRYFTKQIKEQENELHT